jgi:collagen type VII alpha
MTVHSRKTHTFQRNWLWTSGAALPLLLAGCGSRQPANNQVAMAPTERVAGSRQDDEALRVARDAGLPESFAFGGRTWRAHQVHWIGGNAGSGGMTSGTDGAAGTTGELGATGTSGTSGTASAEGGSDAGTATSGGSGTAGSTTGTTGTTGTSDATGATPGSDVGSSAGTSSMDDFVQVASFEVQGHPIFTRKDADEAVTDNIYLRAETSGSSASGTGSDNTSYGSGSTSDSSSISTSGATTGTSGSSGGSTGTSSGSGGTSGTGGTGGEVAGTSGTSSGTATSDSTTSGTRVAFIEYDADDNLVSNMETTQAVQSAGLPETIQFGGKRWTADGVQVFDPDVFHDLKPTAQQVSGHPAFQGRDRDELIVQGEWTGSASPGQPGAGLTPEAGSTPGTTGTMGAPGTSSGATNSGSASGTTTTDSSTGTGTVGGAGTSGSSTAMEGPIFIRYRIGSGDTNRTGQGSAGGETGSTGTTGATGTTTAPGTGRTGH